MKPNLTKQGKVIITAATTGGLHGKEANPNLPEQPEEIVANFKDCLDAGSSLAHIHVRDRRGKSSSDMSIYGEVLSGISNECPGMITQVGNGIGAHIDGSSVSPFTQEERMALLNLQPVPDMLTVNAGTFHFDHKGKEFLFDNSKAWNAEFIRGCRERNIHIELEVYDLSHIANMLELADQGVLETPMHFSFVMGIRGGIPPTPANLLAMLDAIPDGSSWQVVSIGKFQIPLSAMALGMGGAIRVGMEDNVYYRPGELAESNAQLVARAARLATEMNRAIATPQEAREMLGMSAAPSILAEASGA
jgi:3-keto-5-aminohexanoate cleavage enzyme